MALLDSAVGAETEREIFDSVFGQPGRTLPAAFPVRLILNKVPHGEIYILPDENHDTPQVRVTDLLRSLGDMVRSDFLDEIRGEAAGGDFLSGDRLSALGLPVSFDRRTIELHIDIPAALRKTSELALYNREPPLPLAQAIAVSPVSSYLNMRVAVDHIEASSTSTDSGRQPARVALEHALRVDAWVMEADGNYVETAEDPWQRGDIRMVHDAPQRMQRYSVGDLSYPVTGFQRFQTMGGVTVARNFSLQPYRVTQPVGEADFLLKGPARVDILVNDRVARTLELDAGRHNIRDFPFTSGLNNVSLKITDELGRTEIIEQPFLFDGRLLTPGLNEYALSVGYPSVTTSGKYVYDTDLPSASLFLREGISRTVTLGGNLQFNSQQHLLGVESLFATRLGTFHADAAVSRIDAIGSGHRTRLGYRYYDAAAPDRLDQRWTGYIDYTGTGFGALGDPVPIDMFSYETGASYSQRIGRRTSGGLAAAYRLGRAHANTRVANLYLSRSLGPFVTTRLNVEQRNDGELRETTVYLNLAWSPREKRRSVNAAFDTVNRASRISWQQEPEYPVGDIGLSVGTEKSSSDERVFGRASYTGYRSETSIAGEHVESADGVTSQQTGTVQFGTAAVYANGHFAISRPVTDSFAIVIPDKNMKNVTVGINPTGNRFAARSDQLGAGVVPNLPSYLAREISVHTPDLPLGHRIGQESFVVLPQYKSGTVIRIDSTATVLLGGVLLDHTGDPIRLQAGEIVSPDNPQWQPKTVFTNRKGIFRVEAMEPGSYELHLFSRGEAVIRFTIPEGSTGFYDAGTLTVGQTGQTPSA